MCTQKAPKAADPKVKDPQYMRNPWLDAMSMNRSATVGRNALRIDGARAISPMPGLPPPTGPFMPPTMQPPRTGGGGGGGIASVPRMGAGGGGGRMTTNLF